MLTLLRGGVPHHPSLATFWHDESIPTTPSALCAEGVEYFDPQADSWQPVASILLESEVHVVRTITPPRSFNPFPTTEK